MIKMNNLENFVYDALLLALEHRCSDDEKHDCLCNYYENNIDLIADQVARGAIESPSVIVDNDFYNIYCIYFDDDDSVDESKLQELIDHYSQDCVSIYFEEDNYNSNVKYLYSFDVDFTRDFTKEDLLQEE